MSLYRIISSVFWQILTLTALTAATPTFCHPDEFQSLGEIVTNSVDFQCTEEQNSILKTEFTYALLATKRAIEGIATDNEYFSAFYPLKQQNEDSMNFLKNVYFPLIMSLPAKTTITYPLIVTCDPETARCKDPKEDVYATLDDANKVMNACASFWNLAATKDLQGKCETFKDENADLAHFNTKARVIIHEITHTSHMNTPERGKPGRCGDFAYGVSNCWSLALGTYVKDGVKVKEEYAAFNADSYSWMIMGLYWAPYCGYNPPTTGVDDRTLALEENIGLTVQEL